MERMWPRKYHAKNQAWPQNGHRMKMRPFLATDWPQIRRLPLEIANKILWPNAAAGSREQVLCCIRSSLSGPGYCIPVSCKREMPGLFRRLGRTCMPLLRAIVFCIRPAPNLEHEMKRVCASSQTSSHKITTKSTCRCQRRNWI